MIQKENYVSAIEINLVDKKKMLDVQKKLGGLLGKNYIVRNQFQQQEFLYKILNTEKLVVLLILIFIILISAFNIISSLTVLIIDKRRDINSLNSMGLTLNSIRKVFNYKGMLGVFFGGLIGIVVGFSLAYFQQEFGLIKMGEGSFVINTYPVQILLSDLFLVSSIVLVIGYIASWLTSRFMLQSIK